MWPDFSILFDSICTGWVLFPNNPIHMYSFCVISITLSTQYHFSGHLFVYFQSNGDFFSCSNTTFQFQTVLRGRIIQRFAPYLNWSRRFTTSTTSLSMVTIVRVNTAQGWRLYLWALYKKVSYGWYFGSIITNFVAHTPRERMRLFCVHSPSKFFDFGESATHKQWYNSKHGKANQVLVADTTRRKLNF